MYVFLKVFSDGAYVCLLPGTFYRAPGLITGLALQHLESVHLLRSIVPGVLGLQLCVKHPCWPIHRL